MRLELEQIDVEDMLNALNMRNVNADDENEVMFSCPFAGHAHGDEKPSAFMNKETTAWFCHGCKRHGNAITFLSDAYNISKFAATGFLRQRYGLGFREPDLSMSDEVDEWFKEDKFTIEDTIILDEELINRFPMEGFGGAPVEVFSYLNQRGLDENSVRQWQLGFDNKTYRITIPIRDEQGRLRGFKGRKVLDSQWGPKYLNLGDHHGFPTYPVSKIVYGINKKENDCAIICEGEFDAISLWQKGFYSPVAVGGSNFTDHHARQILRNFSSAIVFFDSDEAGEEGAWSVAKRLEPYIPVFIVGHHEGDPASMSVEEIEKAIESVETSMNCFWIPEN